MLIEVRNLDGNFHYKYILVKPVSFAVLRGIALIIQQTLIGIC